MSDKVTLRDVYDIVDRLEQKWDKRDEDKEKRLSSVENFQSREMGIMVTLVFLFSSAMTFVWNKVFGK